MQRRTPEDANHATARSGLKEGAARCGPRYGEERSDGANSNVAATAALTSPTSIDLTTAVSGRRLAGALVLGPGVSSWQTRRLNSLNSNCVASISGTLLSLLRILKIISNSLNTLDHCFELEPAGPEGPL